jgi:uncharacterized protein with FMN-binding domain
VRTRAVVLSALASAGVLVLGWELGASAQTVQNAPVTTGSSSGTGSPTSGSPSGTSSPTSGSSSTTSPTASASGTALTDGNFTGNTANTQFGPVQVQVTVAGGKITDVKALQLTNYGGRSVQISNYAAPILRSEVLKSQSAKVSTVSGATYTSDGYLSSLQSALNKAKA